MTTLVDTSALYALLDADDRNHGAAAAAWVEILDDEVVTHVYVVIEASALVQRRLGMEAVGTLHDGLLGPVRHLPVDETVHRLAVERWRAARRRDLSLVDAASFIVMEDRAIGRVFAFDDDFATAGFEVVPG